MRNTGRTLAVPPNRLAAEANPLPVSTGDAAVTDAPHIDTDFESRSIPIVNTSSVAIGSMPRMVKRV